jgi:hypothetical protein
MDISSPSMVSNPGPHFDQALDQPVDRPFKFFIPNIEVPDNMEEVVGYNPRLEPGLVGLGTLTTGFAPAAGVFALLDPVFPIAPTIVDSGHLSGWES